jgi:hypothetical protein
VRAAAIRPAAFRLQETQVPTFTRDLMQLRHRAERLQADPKDVFRIAGLLKSGKLKNSLVPLRPIRELLMQRQRGSIFWKT